MGMKSKRSIDELSTGAPGSFISCPSAHLNVHLTGFLSSLPRLTLGVHHVPSVLWCSTSLLNLLISCTDRSMLSREVDKLNFNS